MKKYILLVLMLIFVSNIALAKEEVDMNYKQDNAAYWYQKTFETFSNFTKEQQSTLYKIKSIEDAKAISQKDKEAFLSVLDNETIDYLKKAHATEKCHFYDKYQDHEKSYNPSIVSWHFDYNYFKAFAWLLLSDNQQKKSNFIIMCALEMFRRMSEDRNPDSACLIFLTEKGLIQTVEKIYNSSKDEDFKNSLINNVKKLLPKPVYTYNELIRMYYEYTLHYFDLFEKDYHNMAPLFISVVEDTKNKLFYCHSDRIKLAVDLEFYVYENPDYNETDPEKIMRDLIMSGKLDYYLRCPFGHKFKMESNNEESDITRFIFGCHCEELYKDDVNDPDVMSAALAKEFMERKYPNYKKELLEYYEKIVNYDYSKTLTQEDADKNLNFFNLGYSKDNALFVKFGQDASYQYKIYKEYMQAYNELFKK